MTDGLVCPGCGTVLEAPRPPASLQDCPICRLRFWALRCAGPATAEAGAPPAAALGEAATCFFHPDNAASLTCATCGRFVCGLCDIALDGQHACPVCFQQARERNAVASLRHQDTLYDSMALAAGWAWMLFYPSWIFALPAVGYWTIAKWNAPRRYLIPRGRWRYGAALLGLFIVPVMIVFAFGFLAGARRAQGR